MEESDEKIQERYQEEYSRLVKIVSAFESLSEIKEWKILQEEVFNKSLAGIERLLLSETLSPDIDINKLYKLQGEWVWSKQYSDINRFIDSLKKQLSNIKSKLK